MDEPRSEQHVKLIVALEQDEDGYPPAGAESLWTVEVEPGLFKVDNVPFFALGIAVGDIVSATHDAEGYHFKEVVRPSGHSTFRVVVFDASEVPALRTLLTKMGCSTELSHLPRLIAVDVPPSVSLDELRQFLDSGRVQERWDYEEACLGHA